MPTLPNFFWGIRFFFPSTLTVLPYEEVDTRSFLVEPTIGLRWENLLLSGGIQTKQEFRSLSLGSSEYQSQIGITRIHIDLQPTCYKKANYEIFASIGGGIQIPSISITSNTQSQEDLTLIQEQYTVDLFSSDVNLGLGVRRYFDDIFIGIQNQQRLIWNPIFSDEFGTESRFLLKSETSVIIGWLL